jgi:hypothetical protein
MQMLLQATGEHEREQLKSEKHLASTELQPDFSASLLSRLSCLTASAKANRLFERRQYNGG